MTKIISKIPDYTGDKVGTWPSMEPVGDKGYFRIDKSTGKLTDEPPEPLGNCFGRAPTVIQDSIEPYYHPRLERYVDSRSKLEMVDKALGTITMGKDEKPSITPQQIRERIRKEHREDIKQARLKAMAKLDAEGGFTRDEKLKAACKERNEQIANQLGRDTIEHDGKKLKLK